LCRQNPFDVGLDEAGMRMPPANVMNFDVGVTIGVYRGSGVRDVLTVLATTGVAVLRGENNPKCTRDACGGHLHKRVVEEGVPIPHTNKNRKLRTACFETFA
jgi:hypothetical protein